MYDFRMLPEWADCRAVMIAWPYPTSDWSSNYDSVSECYWRLTQTIANVCELWVLLHPTLDSHQFSQQLEAYGLTHRVKFRTDISYDDTWVRDYAPISREGSLLNFVFNGWGDKYPSRQDNAAPEQMQDWLGELASIPIVCEGGGLDINSKGALLLNSLCIVDEKRNPNVDQEKIELILREQLGVSQFAWIHKVALSNDDTDGHIDTLARFANDNTVLYCGLNTDHHDAKMLSRLSEQVIALADTHNWHAIELPTPVLYSDVDGRALPATYVNFLICNNVVFLPTYGCPEDALAHSILEAVFEGYRIIDLNCAALAEQHGSLHCATMNIADAALPYV